MARQSASANASKHREEALPSARAGSRASGSAVRQGSRGAARLIDERTRRDIAGVAVIDAGRCAVRRRPPCCLPDAVVAPTFLVDVAATVVSRAWAPTCCRFCSLAIGASFLVRFEPRAGVPPRVAVGLALVFFAALLGPARRSSRPRPTRTTFRRLFDHDAAGRAWRLRGGGRGLGGAHCCSGQAVSSVILAGVVLGGARRRRVLALQRHRARARDARDRAWTGSRVPPRLIRRCLRIYDAGGGASRR